MRDSVKSKILEGGEEGAWGGERETFFKKVSLSPPSHSALYGN